MRDLLLDPQTTGLLPATLSTSLKDAIYAALAKVPDDGKFYFFMGCLYGASELELEHDAPPSLDLPYFREGRNLVLDISRAS
jgi:hypothetical protein